MASRSLLRRVIAALRDGEKQLDFVAEVLQPGPLGLAGAKETHAEAAAAKAAVEAAKRRWAESRRPGGCSDTQHCK